ncbi:hypothetical protein LEP1GSC036_2185 [Leptospira weilii str. 2006001853]|uniref:Uncharacterized protein n=4 Tax=Leptospira weilii TaxID=28184 RepID=A0A828Z0V5_9LEPT|nr:hypothetical protein LEP1GSC036_2185 [Leptospira weilii str. 2006001853]EMJ64802.1 hypothetical protein LEP1GSC051_4543 [Leptospira sp. P2653]EMM72639.1 hypothetical protein LEP1GSC038_1999 [Leptospira weilii str. 2006001855]EMN43757.1 hypothetical protein LEP1GSC086_4473 [Leptospira weilii str. LNT 1234]EMN89161.1 hypothetical protein LEP1GSC108_0996 [Leptospira weilii str. UI 13098]EMY15233.1 hypothetical protein LEP1GSC043_0489 [Leptospira weilii str. Ecochallenge]
MFLPGLNWQNIFKKAKYCKKNNDTRRTPSEYFVRSLVDFTI